MLRSIRDLVVKRAENDGITIDRDLRDRSGDASREGERCGIELGQVEVDEGKPDEESDEERQSNVMKKSCFRDLVEASKSATNRFEVITVKIHDALGMLGHLGRAKAVLDEDTRARIFLTERDIDDMERQIESHKLEVNIALTAFEAIL